MFEIKLHHHIQLLNSDTHIAVGAILQIGAKAPFYFIPQVSDPVLIVKNWLVMATVTQTHFISKSLK